MLGIIWGVDWVFGIPTILLLLAFHASGIIVIEWMLRNFDKRRRKGRTVVFYLLLILVTANASLVMHVFEASVWAALYWRIGALPDFQTAMLYSLNALTSYGHEGARLRDDWRLLGAIESMNGVMIFGLTTAYMFNVMLEFRPAKATQ